MFAADPAAHLAEALVRASEYRLQHEMPRAGREFPAGTAWTIAFSRETGTGGAAVAQEVGQRLGWPVYDHQLLERIADEMHVDVRRLEELDERQPGWLWECLQGLGSSPTVTPSAYLRRLVTLLLALGARGQCVIVGRGAAHLLPKSTTLRVRLVAAWDDRVVRVARERGLTRRAAEDYVRKSDAERGAFVREHFNVDAADPLHYDLVLNTSRLSIPACGELVLEALRGLRERAPAGAAAQVVPKQLQRQP